MTSSRIAVVGVAAAALAAGVAMAAPGDTSVVSLDASGAQFGTPSGPGAVSATGRHVAFVNGDQVYVRDRVAGTTTLASSSAAGAPANGAVDAEDVGNVQFAISGDGRFVVFASVATNLTPADTDAGKDVFRKDLVTRAVELISVSSLSAKANGAVQGDPEVSYDGGRVVFGTGVATNLFTETAPVATNSDIVVRDVSAGTTTLAAVSDQGAQANGTTERPGISADGTRVAFEAPAGTTNLAANDTGGGNDVFVRDLAAGTTRPASDPTAAAGSGFPDIAGNGRHVTFETGQKYDPVNDVGAGNDVYRRDMVTGAIVLVSARDGLDAGGNTSARRSAISADGTRVAFGSDSTDLAPPADVVNVEDVYVRDVAAKTTVMASTTSGGAAKSENAADTAAIAGNGALVAFINNDAGATTKLTPGDANAQPDALAKELAPTDTTIPSLTPGASTALAAGTRRVTATASDPSGIGAVTINGVAARNEGAGVYGAAVPVGADPCPATTYTATDGSGNVTTLAVVPGCAGPAPPPTLKPRATVLRAKVVKGKVRVRVRVSAAARVTAQVQRRVVKRFKKAPRRRVVFLGLTKPVARNLTPGGLRTITLKLPKGASPKLRYIVRVWVRNAAGRTGRTVALTIPKPPPARRR